MKNYFLHKAKNEGYDGVVFKNGYDGWMEHGDLYAVFSPTQVRMKLGGHLTEAQSRKHFVGTCKNSFDDDGKCTVRELPWLDVSEFAYADENAVHISQSEFDQNTEIPSKLKQIFKRHNIIYMQSDSVYIAYDDDTDTHYFFT